MAAPFDAERLVVTGTPASIVDGLWTSPTYGTAYFASTANGVLAYVPGTGGVPQSPLVLVDRSGRPEPVGDQRNIASVRLSPKVDRAVVRAAGANDTFWIQDLRRGSTFSRLMFRGNVSGAVWTPDGQRIIYNSANEIASIAADMSGDDRTVHEDRFVGIPTSITPDGKTVIYYTNRPGTTWDIWALSLEDGKTHPVLNTSHSETYPRLSPDGRWIAYTSNESGRPEVYVRPCPAPGRRSLISRDGGTLPVWSPVWSAAGGELYFWRGSDVYLARVLVAGGDLEGDTPRKVPNAHVATAGLDRFDVTPDGRLLFVQTTPQPLPTSLNLITGWLDELAGRMPVR